MTVVAAGAIVLDFLAALGNAYTPTIVTVNHKGVQQLVYRYSRFGGMSLKQYVWAWEQIDYAALVPRMLAGQKNNLLQLVLHTKETVSFGLSGKLQQQTLQQIFEQNDTVLNGVEVSRL